MANLKKKPIAKTKKPAKAVEKKLAAKKAAVKKPVAKKSVAKKMVAKKPVAAKKPVVKKTAAKTSLAKAKTAARPEPQGLPEQMRDAALRVLDERQAEEIVTVSLVGRSSVADYLIIGSGRAGRQVAAIADHLREAFFKLGVRQVRVEGQGEANWVLIDAGDVVIHLFRPEVRRYYDLDGMWNGKAPRS